MLLVIMYALVIRCVLLVVYKASLFAMYDYFATVFAISFL